MQKKIVINALCVGSKLSGVGRVGLEVITEICKQGIEDKFIIIINKGALHHLSGYYNKNFVVVSKFCSSDFGAIGHLLRVLYSNLLPLRYYNYKLWSLSQIEASLFGKNQYIIVHDVIPLIMPEHSLKLFYFFKYYLRVVLSATHMIFTDSEYSRKRILEFYPALKADVNVVYLGVSSNFDLKKKMKDDVILYTGRYSPTKNTEGLLGSFLSYRKAGGRMRLSLCGVRFSDILLKTQEEVKPLIEDGSLSFAGYVSETKLKEMYSSSKAVILPSFEEGFGLTVLEGLAHGCLIACSNRSSIPEVAKDLAIYFDPAIEDQIVGSLFEIERSQKGLDEAYQLKCKQHLEKFNWSDSLTSYLDYLNK